MAASNTRVARETTAASGRSPGPVHARSISQSPWHCGWITIKPMPSAVTGLGAPRTAAFHPGNHATCTDTTSPACRLARMRALPPPRHWMVAAARAASPLACAYLRISEYANLPAGRHVMVRRRGRDRRGWITRRQPAWGALEGTNVKPVIAVALFLAAGCVGRTQTTLPDGDGKALILRLCTK